MRNVNDDNWKTFNVAAVRPSKKKQVTLVVLTLLCTLSALAGVASLGGQKSNPLTTVFVPVGPIKSGTALTSEMFEPTEIKSAELISDPVTRTKELSGRYAKIELLAGQQVSLRSLMDPPTEGALTVSSGRRAVSLDVDETSSIEGYALPGTHVDVALTYYEGTKLSSKIIVQNARVASFGGDTTESTKLKTLRRGGRTLTLEASASDVLRITTAKQLGRISLFMRAPGDDQVPNTLEFSEVEIRGNKQVVKREACRDGRIKMEGREYNLDCDGDINEVLNLPAALRVNL